MSALQMVEHLVGLQAQENLPPYLSLAARIEGFDPHELSDALENKDVVRFLTMRGTIHVLVPEDALSLRSWVQRALDQQSSSNQMSRPARGVPVDDLVAATRRLLEPGPLPVKQLGERLAEIFTGVPAGALAHTARERVPMVQVPPRGCGSDRAASSTRPSRAISAAPRRRSTCVSSYGATCARSGPARRRT